MNWDLRAGDCLDPVTGLASLADKSIDVVITDPPYSEHVDANSVRGNGNRPGGVRKYGLGFAPMNTAVMEAVSDQVARICRRWALVFCDVESSHLWAGALRSTGGLEYIRTGAWIKEGASPQFTGDRPAVGFEAVVIAHVPGKKRWNGGGRHGLWTCSTAHRQLDDVVHTTQKPAALMEALVRDFTDPNETILDPFAGSGTTGVAAIRLGRSFVGWERDAKYHAAAVKRLGGAREQATFAAVAAPKMKQQKMGGGSW